VNEKQKHGTKHGTIQDTKQGTKQVAKQVGKQGGKQGGAKTKGKQDGVNEAGRKQVAQSYASLPSKGIALKHSFDLASTLIDYDEPISHATHLDLLRKLASEFLTSSTFCQRCTLIHPLTPLRGISIGKRSRPTITLTFGSPTTLEEIGDLLQNIKSIFTEIYSERLICSSCLNRISLGNLVCVCGCKRLLALPAQYSDFVPLKMANKLHWDQLRPAKDSDVTRLSRILAKSHEDVGLEESMEGLALQDSPLASRNREAEGDFIEYFNKIDLATILRQRVKGHRTLPLSLAASTMKCVQNLKDVISDNDGARLMSADLSQYSPMYDLLLDEMGDDDRFVRWRSAKSDSAMFDFGEFGNVVMKGSPDCIFNEVPVELKTVKSSLKLGATRDKIRSWSMQVAAYQKTHGVGGGKAGRGILLLVSLQDLEVIALNIEPENFVSASNTWKKNLNIVFGGRANRYRKYWDCVVRFQNQDVLWRAKHHHEVRRTVKNWQEEDSKMEIAEGLALIPGIMESEVAARFQSKVSLGRKLCLRGRKSWQARKEDRSARAVLNSIKRDTTPLFKNGNRMAIARWEALQKNVEGGRAAAEDVRLECKAVLKIFVLMKAISVWRDKKAEGKTIEKAMSEIRAKAKEWKSTLGGRYSEWAEVETFSNDEEPEGDNGEIKDSGVAKGQMFASV